MATIASQLPIKFEGSDFSMDEFTHNCPNCGVRTPDENTTGNVVHVLESVAAVDGTATCPNCAVITNFSFRLRSDSIMEVPGPDGWLRMDFTPKPPRGIIRRAADWVKGELSLLKGGGV